MADTFTEEGDDPMPGIDLAMLKRHKSAYRRQNIIHHMGVDDGIVGLNHEAKKEQLVKIPDVKGGGGGIDTYGSLHVETEVKDRTLQIPESHPADYGEKTTTDYELWVRKSRYNHGLEVGRHEPLHQDGPEFINHRIPELIRGIRERLSVDENPSNLPYFFEPHRGCEKVFCLDIFSSFCNSESSSIMTTDKSRDTKKQMLFPEKCERHCPLKGKRRIEKCDELGAFATPTLDLDFLLDDLDDLRVVPEPVEIKLDEVVGEVACVPDNSTKKYKFKIPETHKFLKKYIPEYVDRNTNGNVVIVEDEEKTPISSSLATAGTKKKKDGFEEVLYKQLDILDKNAVSRQGEVKGKQPKTLIGKERKDSSFFGLDEEEAEVEEAQNVDRIEDYDDDDKEHTPKGLTVEEYDQRIRTWAEMYATRHHQANKYRIESPHEQHQNTWDYILFGGGGTYVYTGKEMDASEENKWTKESKDVESDSQIGTVESESEDMHTLEPLDSGFSNNVDKVYVLEGHEFKELVKKKLVRSDAQDNQNVHSGSTVEDSEFTWDHILFGGGGRGGGGEKDHAAGEEKAVGPFVLLGTMHFKDGTVWKNRLVDLNESQNFNLDMSDAYYIKRAKEAGWQEMKEAGEPVKEAGEPMKEEKTRQQWKRNDNTIAYVKKYFPDLLETDLQTRIDLECYRYSKLKSKQRNEKSMEQIKFEKQYKVGAHKDLRGKEDGEQKKSSNSQSEHDGGTLQVESCSDDGSVQLSLEPISTSTTPKARSFDEVDAKITKSPKISGGGSVVIDVHTIHRSDTDDKSTDITHTLSTDQKAGPSEAEVKRRKTLEFIRKYSPEDLVGFRGDGGLQHIEEGGPSEVNKDCSKEGFHIDSDARSSDKTGANRDNDDEGSELILADTPPVSANLCAADNSSTNSGKNVTLTKAENDGEFEEGASGEQEGSSFNSKLEGEEVEMAEMGGVDIEGSNVKIFGDETKRVLMRLEFNPDDPFEPNQEIFLEKPIEPTLYQQIFGGGAKFYIAGEIDDGSSPIRKASREIAMNKSNEDALYNYNTSGEIDSSKPKIRTKTAEWSPVKGWSIINRCFDDFGFAEKGVVDHITVEGSIILTKKEISSKNPLQISSPRMSSPTMSPRIKNMTQNITVQSFSPRANKPVDEDNNKEGWRPHRSPMGKKFLDPSFYDLIENAQDMISDDSKETKLNSFTLPAKYDIGLGILIGLKQGEMGQNEVNTPPQTLAPTNNQSSSSKAITTTTKTTITNTITPANNQIVARDWDSEYLILHEREMKKHNTVNELFKAIDEHSSTPKGRNAGIMSPRRILSEDK